MSDLSVRDHAIMLVDQANLDAGARTAADVVLGRVGARDQRRADLCHVEQRKDIHAEPFAEGTTALSERDNEHHAQPMVAISWARRLFQQERRHRAEQEGGGDFQFPDLVPERLGAEMADHADRAADTERNRRDKGAADMEDRHVQQLPVIGCEAIPGIRSDA